MTNEQVCANIYQRVSPQQLQAVIEECTRLVRPVNDTYFDFLGNRYRYIRQFASDFLAAFTFHSNLNLMRSRSYES